MQVQDGSTQVADVYHATSLAPIATVGVQRSWDTGGPMNIQVRAASSGAVLDGASKASHSLPGQSERGYACVAGPCSAFSGTAFAVRTLSTAALGESRQARDVPYSLCELLPLPSVAVQDGNIAVRPLGL